MARVEVKVAKLQLSMKEKALVREKALVKEEALVKEKALVKEEGDSAMLGEEEEDNKVRVSGKAENIISEEGEEEEKGRQRLQEQVRQCDEWIF